MDVWCVCAFSCVCVVLCLGRGLATSWSPVQGVLPSVRSRNWEIRPMLRSGSRGRKKKTLSMREARCDVEANMNSGVGLLIFCYKICYALWIGYDGASRVNKCSPGIACFMLPNVYVALLPGKHCQPFSLPRYCQLVLTRSCHCAFIDSSSVLSAYCRISGKTVEVHIDDFGFHQLYCETCVFFFFFWDWPKLHSIHERSEILTTVAVKSTNFWNVISSSCRDNTSD
jgi:hypothetical protein